MEKRADQDGLNTFKSKHVTNLFYSKKPEEKREAP
jgi:hypothetical protein